MRDSSYVDLLLVEDDPLDLELALRALHEARFDRHLEIMRDGAEALDFLFAQGPHSGRAVENVPSAILLDIKMPKVDGFEVLRRLKGDARTSSVPVIMLSSSREHKDVVDSYRLGANSYILKPVDFEEYALALNTLCSYWLGFNQHPGGLNE